MNKNIVDDIYISGYDPDKWFDKQIVGGEIVTPGKLGYYLGWLESLTVKELKVMINEISDNKEHNQWYSIDDNLSSKSELINVLLCKYSPLQLEQKIIEHHNK